MCTICEYAKNRVLNIYYNQKLCVFVLPNNPRLRYWNVVEIYLFMLVEL